MRNYKIMENDTVINVNVLPQTVKNIHNTRDFNTWQVCPLA